MGKQIKLYNVFFPVWLLVMIPQTWIAVFPVNFLVDSLVLILLMRQLQVAEKKQFYKKHIAAVFFFGLVADLVGAMALLLAVALELGTTGEDLYLTIPAVALSGLCIYLAHYFVIFRRQEKPVRKKLALTFAIATAPYTFLIPIAWLYGW